MCAHAVTPVCPLIINYLFNCGNYGYLAGYFSSVMVRVRVSVSVKLKKSGAVWTTMVSNKLEVS